MRALGTETSVRVVRGKDNATAGPTRVVRGSYCTGEIFTESAATPHNLMAASVREMGNAGCRTRALRRVMLAEQHADSTDIERRVLGACPPDVAV